MVDNTIIALPGHVEATRTGLIFTDGITFREWEYLGATLRDVEGAVQWWIGDWLNYGERKWGEYFAQAVDEPEADRWKNYKWVANKVERSTRVDNLSWSHHREVAKLDEPEQRKWLGLAVEQGLTKEELHQAINAPALDAGDGQSETRRIVLDLTADEYRILIKRLEYRPDEFTNSLQFKIQNAWEGA
jgi:hypothetical protein